MRIALIAGIVLLLAALPGAALAQDWYVDGANGSDDYSAWRVHDGFAVAYRSIGQAVRKAAAGDAIHVAAGTYSEYISIDKQLSITGEAGVVIDGQQREQCGVAIQQADGTTLTNLTFIECSYGVYVNSSTVTIANCVFRDNASAVFVFDPQGKAVAVTGSAFIRNTNAIHTALCAT